MNPNPNEATRWKPGQSGNPGGRPKTKLVRTELLEAIGAIDAEGTTTLRRVINQLIEKAISGDVQAIKEIADRLDGKVPTAIVGDRDEDPLNVVTRIELVPVAPRPRD